MSNVLVGHNSDSSVHKLRYNREEDKFEFAPPNTKFTGPLAIQVFCRRSEVTIITVYTSVGATELIRVTKFDVPVQRVYGTYSEYYYLTTNNEVVDSRGVHYPKSTFNGGEVYLIGCTSGGVTFVTTNGLFYKGGNSYGELGTGSTALTVEVTESPFSETLRKRGEKIIDIQCGDHNTVLLTEQGKVYITGYCLYNTFKYVNGPTDRIDYDDHLTSYTQVNFPEPIAHICCAYYHLCFTGVSGDLWCSKGLLDITNTLGKSYTDYGISGESVKCDRFKSKHVSDKFGSLFASVKGGDYKALVITKANEVYLPYQRDYNSTPGKMLKVYSEYVRSIMEYGTSLVSSIGETYYAIYTQQTTNRSYATKLLAQRHGGNPFIDVVIN